MDKVINEKVNPSDALASPPTDSSSETAEKNLVFYNIMPKGKIDGEMVQPTLKVDEPIVETKNNNIKQMFSLYKKHILIGVGILILGAGLFFAILKIGGGSGESDIVLITPNPSTKKPGNLVKGFTTSQEWRDKYFPNCTELSLCGDEADADHDGLKNLEESNLAADPNNADSDQDGLSDGDEINVFSSNPLSNKTANDPTYTDIDFAKGGYDFGTGKQMTTGQIESVTGKMKQHGLHEPTIKSLFTILNTLYNFTSTPAGTTEIPAPVAPPTSTIDSSIDMSVEAKQDRDTQRSSTIKNIESGLVRYQADKKTYPVSADFKSMFALVKPYLKVATNPTDPINKEQYVYGYVSDKQGVDFTLSFYSEVAGQIIKKHSAEAINDTNAEMAAVYDEQRKNDLVSLQTALLLYSQKNIAGNQNYVFPGEDKYKTVLVPEDISQIPKDPKTKADYEYKVSETFDTFTLKAVLDKPSAGTTGWLCNQEECRSY